MDYCEYCLKYPHDPQCPLYTPKESGLVCDYCGEPIYVDDEYIENDNGEHIHYECVQGIRWLLEWLGYEVKETNNQYD